MRKEAGVVGWGKGGRGGGWGWGGGVEEIT